MPDDPLGARGAAANYRVLSLADICRFQLPRRYPDSYLLLWRLSSMPRAALDVIACWGYVPKSEIVWHKLGPACARCKGKGYINARMINEWCAACEGRGAKPHFVLGHHTRAAHETCIVAVHGNPKPLNRNVRSVFEAPVGDHSEKPEQFYSLVERLAEGPYVELFARRRRKNWQCLGDEVGKLDRPAIAR